MTDLHILSSIRASQLQVSATNDSTIQINFNPNNLDFELNALVPITKPADQVIQQYQTDGCFDFKKFVEDHRPLKFAGTGDLQDAVIDSSVNRLIEADVVDAYENISFLKQIGFNPKLVNVLLGQESTEIMEEYGLINETNILEPVFFLSNFEHGNLIVEINETKLLGSDEIQLDFNIYPSGENPCNFGAIGVIGAKAIFNVDYAEKKFSIKSIVGQWLQINEYDDEEHDYFMNDFNDWLYDYHQINTDLKVYDQDKVGQFLTKTIQSEATIKALENHLLPQ